MHFYHGFSTVRAIPTRGVLTNYLMREDHPPGGNNEYDGTYPARSLYFASFTLFFDSIQKKLLEGRHDVAQRSLPIVSSLSEICMYTNNVDTRKTLRRTLLLLLHLHFLPSILMCQTRAKRIQVKDALLNSRKRLNLFLRNS